jgi:DNA excision repair protein ERCC-3
MIGRSNRPIIVQNDYTILLNTDHSEIAFIRHMLSQFAELLKSPDHIHTYRVTTLSLWQAAASGIVVDEIIGFLMEFGEYPIPSSIRAFINRSMSRYGSLRLEYGHPHIYLIATEWQVIQEVTQIALIKAYCRGAVDALTIAVDPVHRGDIKRELLRAGFPVIDFVGYHAGQALPSSPCMVEGNKMSKLKLRDYQLEAVNQFYQDSATNRGSGVIVLPCGSGKTMVGIAAMVRMNCETLILTSNVTSVKQWKREILQQTDLESEWIGEYTGSTKSVKPITIATYQILTYRKQKDGPLLHMGLFNERNWGLIIYDEVHVLPSPVFRMTAAIQATRRLGLTATLIREDGHEEDVFALIGPKLYEMRWKALEASGWIASARCVEITVPMSTIDRQAYLQATRSTKNRIAGENKNKIKLVQQLISQHTGSLIIVIGQYLKQLEEIATVLQAPLITGKVSQQQRELLYAQFISGHIPVLVVSKVANFAVDLPEANIAIQISGSYGSRQEEAQRLGRILRPKKNHNEAVFYTLVTELSSEVEFARHRQLFLVEQGYAYKHQTDGYKEEQVRIK